MVIRLRRRGLLGTRINRSGKLLGGLLGAFVDAVIGEWIVHRKQRHALIAGFGVVVGSLLGTVLKFGVSGLMLYYSMWALA